MNYKNVNDYETLYLIGENDEDSMNRLFRKYKPIIISIAKKYHSKMNYHCGELEDFIQEGYIGLNRAIKSFGECRNVLFYTFSVVCIERQIKSYCRSFLSLKNEHINNALSMDFELEENLKLLDSFCDDSVSSNPDLYIEETIVLNDLIHFKNSLSWKQGLIFELRYNGFKYKEISKLLDIPISTVDNCLHICRKKLSNKFTFS